jgi:hypothetical protein
VPSPLSEFYADIQDPSISSGKHVQVSHQALQNYRLSYKNYSVSGSYQSFGIELSEISKHHELRAMQI